MSNHDEIKVDYYRRGIYVFVGLILLTVLEFGAALLFNSTLILGVMSVVKAGIVVYFYMHIYRLNINDESLDRHSYEYRANSNRIGLWLFLLSDSFVFAGLLVTRFGLLGLTRPHLIQLLGLCVTLILLISSFFANRGEAAIEKGDHKTFMSSILITILLGLTFLVGVVAVEWPLAISEGVTPSSSVAGAVFFMLTGMHAFHVLTGLIFLSIIYRNGRRGRYAEKHFPVEAAAVYWHFIDVVWIFFYPALYLIGAVIK
jgi:cytochrome c oxidase subunit III